MVVADAPITMEGVTTELTVIVMGLEVTVAGEAQLAVEVITQVTISP